MSEREREKEDVRSKWNDINWVVATQIFFIFTPKIGGNDPIWRAYFSKGLVQPPTSKWNDIKTLREHGWGNLHFHECRSFKSLVSLGFNRPQPYSAKPVVARVFKIRWTPTEPNSYTFLTGCNQWGVCICQRFFNAKAGLMKLPEFNFMPISGQFWVIYFVSTFSGQIFNSWLRPVMSCLRKARNFAWSIFRLIGEHGEAPLNMRIPSLPVGSCRFFIFF